MIIGRKYNWINQPERLIYLGRKGCWHQFELVDSPGKVWCEILDSDIHRMEETKNEEDCMGEYDKDRDIIAQGKFYTNHVMAMTAESLHSKSDIAAELAYRDMEIERLKCELSILAAGPITWSTESPTTEGWYWIDRSDVDEEPYLDLVVTRPGHSYLAITGTLWNDKRDFTAVQYIQANWAGPIFPPIRKDD